MKNYYIKGDDSLVWGPEHSKHLRIWAYNISSSLNHLVKGIQR